MTNSRPNLQDLDPTVERLGERLVTGGVATGFDFASLELAMLSAVANGERCGQCLCMAHGSAGCGHCEGYGASCDALGPR